jgi:hypothetical protein
MLEVNDSLILAAEERYYPITNMSHPEFLESRLYFECRLTLQVEPFASLEDRLREDPDLSGEIRCKSKTEGEARSFLRRSRPRGQGLYDEETIPNGRAEGKFDGSLEEILHMVTYLW